jgi:hypothetical protein
VWGKLIWSFCLDVVVCSEMRRVKKTKIMEVIDTSSSETAVISLLFPVSFDQFSVCARWSVSKKMKRCYHGYDLWLVRHLLSTETDSPSLDIVAKEQPTWNRAAWVSRIRSNCVYSWYFLFYYIQPKKWICGTWQTLNFIFALFIDAFNNILQLRMIGWVGKYVDGSSRVLLFRHLPWGTERNV